MQEPKVSILVPVYNVERYLKQCLDSIAAQTFDDWECVIVDDGSTDSSGVMADEYAAGDKRFRVIHQANGGLAAARITLIGAARGKYISWVDSDDWVEPDFIKVMYDDITEFDADIVQVGLWREYTTYSREKNYFEEKRVLSRDVAILELINDKRMPSYMCNKMFRRCIVGTNFPVGKAFEDIYAITEWFKNVNSMVVDPTPLYHYRMRRSSIMNENIGPRRIDYVDVCRYRASVMRELFSNVFTEQDINNYIAKALISAAKTVARHEPNANKRIEVLNKLSAMALDVPDINESKMSAKARFRFNLLRKNPKLFERITRGAYTINPNLKKDQNGLFE